MQDVPVCIAGVVADTHIPDRAPGMHPQVCPALRQAGVSVILHAGDISTPHGLDDLKAVAPVVAVRGNRDWAFFPALPLVRRLELGGVVVALMHGHGGFINYIRDKMVYLREGYDLQRYLPKLVAAVPDARVIIFGHTHRAENLRLDGRLILNPGSANLGFEHGRQPSIAILRIYAGGRAEAEILPMTGYQVVQGAWQEIQGKTES